MKYICWYHQTLSINQLKAVSEIYGAFKNFHADENWQFKIINHSKDDVNWSNLASLANK